MINLPRELQKVIGDALHGAANSIVTYDRLKAPAIHAELQATAERIAAIFHAPVAPVKKVEPVKPVAPAKPKAKRKPAAKKVVK